MTKTLRYVIIVKIYRILLLPMSIDVNPRATLNLRIKPADRDLIDRAAAVSGKNRTDFILEAARASAEDILLKSTIVWANSDAYAEFLRLLEAPPAPNDRLRKTMEVVPPWDRP
jgi:uncharacterized protein (DUF1778 family)